MNVTLLANLFKKASDVVCIEKLSAIGRVGLHIHRTAATLYCYTVVQATCPPIKLWA